MLARSIAWGIVLSAMVLTGCSSTPPTGNGSMYTTRWGDESTTLSHLGIGADGSVGAPTALVEAPSDEHTFVSVIDGRGDLVVTGTFVDYWTASLQVRRSDSGEVIGEVEAPGWCGGEGAGYNPCVMLDAQRLARTSQLSPDVDGGSVIISALNTGETVAEYGPVAGLITMLPTTDPNVVLLITAEDPSSTAEMSGGMVRRMDVTSGAQEDVAAYPASWSPLCAVGTSGVIGYALLGTPRLQSVGATEVTDVEWTEEDLPVGCSADSRYLFLQRIPTSNPDGSQPDLASDPPTTLDAVDLSDGSRREVAPLESQVWAGPATL